MNFEVAPEGVPLYYDPRGKTPLHSEHDMPRRADKRPAPVVIPAKAGIQKALTPPGCPPARA